VVTLRSIRTFQGRLTGTEGTMRSLLTAVVLTLAGAAITHAEPLRAAVFPFELDDTSLQGSMQGQQPDDLARLTRLDTQLRDALMQSGRYTPIVVPEDPAARTLWSCNGCDVEIARKAGARVSVIGWVQKVSNLILNLNVVIRDVGTGQRIAAGSVDIRGDTDESWRRGLAYLLRNRVLSGEATH
jgi:hypothetical protein